MLKIHYDVAMNPARHDRSPRLIAALLALSLCLLSANVADAAKNVIIMVADGAGYNTWLAAAMYQGRVGRQTFDQPGWTRLACTTYPLNQSDEPTNSLKQLPRLVYDPQQAWDATPKSDKPGDFAGYHYLKTTATDSAAAASALATGRKTYNGAINWTDDDRPMRGETIAEIAHRMGKSAGVVTSVPWSHATPAALGGAHNRSRNNYAEIAREMLQCEWLDVIMGAGNPDFDDDGRPIAEGKQHNYAFVGGEDSWNQLKAEKLPWKLLESKGEIEALAAGATPPKVLATVRAATTLQAKRTAAIEIKPAGEKPLPVAPFSVPMNEDVPTLANMARAAINCLDDNPKGFYLMIEGGAVDWANHANQAERMIEEQIAFIEAVKAVVEWIEVHGGWDETLLIITADHDCGLPWGPKSKQIAFDPLEDRGAGNMPGLVYHSNGHGNSLVPLMARGPGSERFATLIKGKDARAATVWKISGQYIDNTDVFKMMRAEVEKQ
jgi:alkaline phosphatase